MTISNCLVAAVFCFVLNACCGTKKVNKLTPENSIEYTKIETYTSPALVAQGNCQQPLTNLTFSKALEKLENEKSELSRIELAEKIIEFNCLTCYQISRLMELFGVESSKLSIAKSAYHSCYDLDNYFIVTRALSLEPSKRELQDYIDKQSKF